MLQWILSSAFSQLVSLKKQHSTKGLKKSILKTINQLPTNLTSVQLTAESRQKKDPPQQ